MSTTTPGRPRDGSIDAAVLASALQVLDAGGLGSLTIEDVARRAGVSKAAVYRRWTGRTGLALAAVRTRLTELEAPDTDCTLCDLDELLQLATRVHCALGPGTLAQLLAAAVRDETLHEQLLAAVVEPVRSVLARTLERARDRGDLLDDVDLRLTADTLSALVLQRLLVERRPLSPEEATAVVTATLRGIAADPAALIRRAREVGHAGHPPGGGSRSEGRPPAVAGA